MLKRFLNIQDLSSKWKDGLEFTVTALLGRSTRRISLNKENFTQGRIFF
jgi:hypothetical protein